MGRKRRPGSIVAAALLLMLLLASRVAGRDEAGSKGQEQEADGSRQTRVAGTQVDGASWPRGKLSDQSCLPAYGRRQRLLQVNHRTDQYEAFPIAVDLNGDGLEDVVVSRSNYLTYDTFKLDFLLNDGQGAMTLATSSIFEGTVPSVQNPAEVVVADFNGDDRPDIFVADHGYDLPPFPGYQNILVLSTPAAKLRDGTAGLPQQSDFSHSACAGDIDSDEDVDLYVANIWGGSEIDPQIWLNNGSGQFTVAAGRLPPLTSLTQNGYTACTFADVDSDDDLDLILGDAGDDIPNPHSTATSEVLLNNGTGTFDRLPEAMPAKGAHPDISHDIKLIELNGDGHVDLLVEYQVPESVSYIQALVNNGDGTFRDETATRLEPAGRQASTSKLKLRDLDRDGDLVLLAPPWDPEHPDPLLWLNDGDGHFAWTPHSFGLVGGDLYLAFLDLEGDGGHDILLTLVYPPEYVYAVHDMGCPLFLPLVCRNCQQGN